MTKSPLLDTHVWVWWMLGDARLPARERAVLDDLPGGHRPRVCDISQWEVAMLVQLGRLKLDDSLEDWLRIAASPATVEVIPITSAIVSEMNRLPANFHQDPADRLIVATARARKLLLATHDVRIRRSRQASLWAA
ncbi:MAG: type II toxin-antitoxin system VapC family toxin [Planctomycetes bacterium]|nr:type II toxin-antitoxin system VapC family toxin [Planctomycetota bacterium]